MEPKKVKKLVLNKEVIANLNVRAMSRVKGGNCVSVGCPGSDWFCTGMPMCSIDTLPITPDCGGGGPGSNGGYTPQPTGGQGYCCDDTKTWNMDCTMSQYPCTVTGLDICQC